MTDTNEQALAWTDLETLARARSPDAPCAQCQALVCPGWDSMPGSFDRAALERMGTLRDPRDDDPTVAEYHPGGTHSWSPDAPIALGYFPYNRCDVWRCAACRRAFLRYTEYGGYYTDERIRVLNAAHLVDERPSTGVPG